MTDEFLKELQDSLYLHFPLDSSKVRSMESSFKDKKVLSRKTIWDGSRSKYTPVAKVSCGIDLIKRGDRECIRMTAPLRSGEWPNGEPDGEYAVFGIAILSFKVDHEDWSGYNRLRFMLKPCVPGLRQAHVHAAITNGGGSEGIPDFLRERDSLTALNINNGEENECYWEFARAPHDDVTELKFYVLLGGQEIHNKPELTYDFWDITLEKVEKPAHDLGWNCAEGSIAYSTAGYLAGFRKTAVAADNIENFCILDRQDKEVYRGICEKIQSHLGRFSVLDFSPVHDEGWYRIKAGGILSEEFYIGDGQELFHEAIWKSVNLFYTLRCGCPVPGVHSVCHLDAYAEHEGQKIPFGGGWHDAADLSQQAVQSGELLCSLLRLIEQTRKDPMLNARLREEAEWGLSYLLRTRFGDGFRATSAGMTRWTDGMIGNFDDVPCRVSDSPLANFSLAGAECYASLVFADDDRSLASSALFIAREDYKFAKEGMEKHGYRPFSVHEHVFSSAKSTFHGIMVKTASLLYKATKEESYAEDAREYAKVLLHCQETGGGAPVTGFFYRDESHRAISHFNHQSRENCYAEALALLIETQPDSSDRALWERAASLYGEYNRFLIRQSSPYGMLPAGIHRFDEPEDVDTFNMMHYYSDYASEKDNYIRQLNKSQKLDDHHALRQFPVWFSFRGNNGVLLAQGKSAVICGKLLGDPSLVQAGLEQIYWVLGKNPFSQSLMYGCGANCCELYSVWPGKTVGSIPVGIQSWQNEDVPYWPQSINATYKEMWNTPSYKLLSLISEFI